MIKTMIKSLLRLVYGLIYLLLLSPFIGLIREHWQRLERESHYGSSGEKRQDRHDRGEQA